MNSGTTPVAARWQRWSLGVARAVGEPCFAAAFVCLVVTWTEESRWRGHLLGVSCLLVGAGSFVVRCAARWVGLLRAGIVAMGLGLLGVLLAGLA